MVPVPTLGDVLAVKLDSVDDIWFSQSAAPGLCVELPCLAMQRKHQEVGHTESVIGSVQVSYSSWCLQNCKTLCNPDKSYKTQLASNRQVPRVSCTLFSSGKFQPISAAISQLN